MIFYRNGNNEQFIDSSLKNLGLESFEYKNFWESFSPVAMTSQKDNQGCGITVFSKDVNDETSYLAWRIFNHTSNDYYADLGQVGESDIEKSIYFQFEQKKNIRTIKFNFLNIVKPVKIALSVSLDGIIYQQINKYNICYPNDVQFNSHKMLYIQNNLNGNYLSGSPLIICDFNNFQSYKYYKLSFINIAEDKSIYQIRNNTTRICLQKMFLYNSDSIEHPVIKYQFKNNIDDYNEELYSESTGISFQQQKLLLNNKSFVKIDSNVLYGSKSMTISFLANLINENDKDINGTLFSKGENNFNIDFTTEYGFMTFTSLQDNSQIGLYATDENSYFDDLYYFKQDFKLIKYEFNHKQINMIKLNKDEKIYFFKKSDGFSSGGNQFVFKSNGKLNVSGNIMSLCGFAKTINYNYQFYKLFQDNKSIIDASQLILPNNVRYQCYYLAFSGCSNLIKAPYLPAVNLANYCYERMFENCSNLIEIKVAFTNWNNSATSNWVANISSNGVFIKPADLSNKYDFYSIPNKWETKQLQDNDIPIIIQNEKYVILSINNVNNFVKLIKFDQFNNIENRYTFTFGQNYEKFYFNSNKQYQIEKSNRFANKFLQLIYIGCNNQQLNNITKTYFRNLSFYNYEADIVDILKENN